MGYSIYSIFHCHWNHVSGWTRVQCFPQICKTRDVRSSGLLPSAIPAIYCTWVIDLTAACSRGSRGTRNNSRSEIYGAREWLRPSPITLSGSACHWDKPEYRHISTCRYREYQYKKQKANGYKSQTTFFFLSKQSRQPTVNWSETLCYDYEYCTLEYFRNMQHFTYLHFRIKFNLFIY